MKERIRKYWFPALGFAVSLVAALFWVALRINHSGISKFLGADTNPSFLIMNLPVMVCVLAWIGCGFSLAGILCWERKRWPAITGLVTGVVMTVAAVAVIIFGAKDYLRFILPHFWESLIISACIVAFALLLYFPICGRHKLKAAIVAVVVLVAVVLGYQLRPCDLTYGAVVYAVEDEYQIVFSTSDSSIVWVTVDGKPYYELYAGSMKSGDTVHKVTVPQAVLDAAGSYEISYRQVIYRGPFGGYLGKEKTQQYQFRPVDAADGLNYFAMSDVHEAVDAAAKAASYGEDLDFIVLLGDLVSMVETEKDAQIANELAHKVTGGEIPVLYARGNHEIKGEYAEDFHKYVGAKGEDFYYTATLGEDVFVVILDMGEDHEDDWWEYYSTAHFDIYRQEQTEMLEKILEKGEYKNYPYRLALCHIPVVYVDKNGYFEKFRNDWTDLLNEMEIDMCLSGHKHVLWPFVEGQVTPYETLVYDEAFPGKGGKTEGGYLTDFRFTGYLVGRRSLVQEGDCQSNGYDQYLGLYVHADFAEGTQTSYYINSLGQIPVCEYPFAEGNVDVLITQLKRP